MLRPYGKGLLSVPPDEVRRSQEPPFLGHLGGSYMVSFLLWEGDSTILLLLGHQEGGYLTSFFLWKGDSTIFPLLGHQGGGYLASSLLQEGDPVPPPLHQLEGGHSNVAVFLIRLGDAIVPGKPPF